MTIDFYQLVSIIIECFRLVSVVIQLDVTQSLNGIDYHRIYSVFIDYYCL